MLVLELCYRINYYTLKDSLKGFEPWLLLLKPHLYYIFFVYFIKIENFIWFNLYIVWGKYQYICQVQWCLVILDLTSSYKVVQVETSCGSGLRYVHQGLDGRYINVMSSNESDGSYKSTNLTQTFWGIEHFFDIWVKLMGFGHFQKIF